MRIERLTALYMYSGTRIEYGFCSSYLSGFRPVDKINASNAMMEDWLVRTFNAGCILKRIMF